MENSYSHCVCSLFLVSTVKNLLLTFRQAYCFVLRWLHKVLICLHVLNYVYCMKLSRANPDVV